MRGGKSYGPEHGSESLPEGGGDGETRRARFLRVVVPYSERATRLVRVLGRANEKWKNLLSERFGCEVSVSTTFSRSGQALKSVLRRTKVPL